MRGWLLAVVVLMGCGAANGYEACAEMVPALCDRYQACGWDAGACRSAVAEAAAGRWCCGPSCSGAVSSAAADACRAQISAVACSVLERFPVPSCLTAVVASGP